MADKKTSDKPEQITVDKAKAIKGLGVEYPSTAPMPIEEAVAYQEKVDAAVKKSSEARSQRSSSSLERRVAVLEHAIGGQGIDLNRIDATELGLVVEDTAKPKATAKAKAKAKSKAKAKTKAKAKAKAAKPKPKPKPKPSSSAASSGSASSPISWSSGTSGTASNK